MARNSKNSGFRLLSVICYAVNCHHDFNCSLKCTLCLRDTLGTRGGTWSVTGKVRKKSNSSFKRVNIVTSRVKNSMRNPTKRWLRKKKKDLHTCPTSGTS